MDRYDHGIKDSQSCKSKAMQIAKEAEHKGMACMPVSVELLTDLVLHVGDQEQRAERAEAACQRVRAELNQRRKP